MKKAEMIEALANQTGLTKTECEKVFNATFEMFKEELSKGNDVAVNGFGTFKVATRAARDGINPLTKEPLHIPEKKVVSFKSGKALKEEMNK